MNFDILTSLRADLMVVMLAAKSVACLDELSRQSSRWLTRQVVCCDLKPCKADAQHNTACVCKSWHYFWVLLATSCFMVRKYSLYKLLRTTATTTNWFCCLCFWYGWASTRVNEEINHLLSLTSVWLFFSISFFICYKQLSLPRKCWLIQCLSVFDICDSNNQHSAVGLELSLHANLYPRQYVHCYHPFLHLVTLTLLLTLTTPSLIAFLCIMIRALEPWNHFSGDSTIC